MTWEPILEYVVQFDWSMPIVDDTADAAYSSRASDSLIYATAHDRTSGSQQFGVWSRDIHLYASRDFFRTRTVLVPHGNRFLFGDFAYLFVEALDTASDSHEAVRLHIARDNSTTDLPVFHTAQLPGHLHLTERSYTILDTSEGSVFLHATHRPFAENANAGHLYTSDWTGLSYTIALPRAHRSLEGHCDFEKIAGVEGIYLANFVDDANLDDEEEAESMGQEERPYGSGHRGEKYRRSMNQPRRERLRTKTVITFDKGGEWSYLTPPTVDSFGKPIVCEGECHLHLHGATSAHGPFYSTAAAVGLIMGTGTIGSSLQQHLDSVHTFLSRDAGLTWREVAKGSHIFEFGNHGAIICMARDTEYTDRVLYSVDEGATWITKKIADQPLLVSRIVIAPEANSRQFILFGHRDDVGVIVHLDFAQLHRRECTGHDRPDNADSDYERWTPSDRRLSGHCVLGRTVTYIRRKPDAACSVPEEFSRPVTTENCACTATDFECDYGYERVPLDFNPTPQLNADPPRAASTCQPMATTPVHANPFDGTPCTHSHTYRVSRGYRRVPGDSCVGGAEWEAVEAACPTWLNSDHVGKIILVLLVLLAASGLAVAIGSRIEGATSIARIISRARAAIGLSTSPAYHPVGVGLVGSALVASAADDESRLASDDDDDDPESGEARARHTGVAASHKSIHAHAAATTSGTATNS